MASHRDRYLELILRRIDEDRYPSGQLMDLAEAAITKPEHRDAYVDVLLDKADETHYPSLQMLRRIDRLAEP
jgi:hypothetical protein